jgi:succinate-acetate transporter protein/CBS domain-containing protein
MLVKDVMSADIAAVRADAPLAEAVELLERSDDGVVAVFAEGNGVVGTLSEHDIATWIARPDRDMTGALVQDVMRTGVPYSREDQDVREAARLMREQHLTGLMVMRGNRPVGAVTLADLAAQVDGADASRSATRSSPQASPGQHTQEQDDEQAPPARVFLQPIAAPSVLGLLGLAGATFMVGAYYAGWFGGGSTPLYLAPFVAVFGGLAQLLAGMWAYKARDAVATAVHGTWGSFWLAYGILYAMVAGHTLTTSVNPGFGWWFIPLAAITGATALAAIGRNLSLSAMLFTLTAACIVGAIGFLLPSGGWVIGAGYVFMAAAIIAWYTAVAVMLEGSFRRVILPIGKPLAEANIPGRRHTRPIEWRYGEPGVRAG